MLSARAVLAPALALALIGSGPPGPARAEPGPADDAARLTLPSGLEATFHEMLWDRPGDGLVYRFRFVAPAFRSAGADVERVGADLAFLCQSYAVPRLAKPGPQPSRIIVSLADRAAEFGALSAEVDQVFEVFSIRDETCIWEMF